MKLIIINGPAGVGKTTLAKKIWEKMPMSFLLDLDEQRAFISHYREFRQESGKLSFDVSLAIAETCLKEGRDFISGKGMMDFIWPGQRKNVLDILIDIGKKYDAQVYEIFLWASKETVVQRANKRGYHVKIWHSPERVVEGWEEMKRFKNKRKNAICIDTDNLDEDEVLNKVLKIIDAKL